jgi:hypothetical protein
VTYGPARKREATGRPWLIAAALALLVALCAPGPASASHGKPPFGKGSRDVCSAPKRGHARCFAEVATTAPGPTAAPLVTPGPAGYGPGDLRDAYSLGGLARTGGAGQTVAVVGAFDDPSAEQDLATYRAQFGLPPCTTANGCFRKVNQTGQPSPLPAANFDWALEDSLDLQAVSAICPNCRLVLVEAASDIITDLAIAANTAGGLATQVSNSYGVDETAIADFKPLELKYTNPGVSMIAASGDGGVGVNYPASSPNVTAAGGTSLTAAAGTARGWTETAWDGAGRGCSALARPAWQPTRQDCATRVVADVSAVSDPNTGLAVFGPSGTPAAPPSVWQVVGGTSAASPIVAAYEALLGAATAGPAFPYSPTAVWTDVGSGPATPACGAVATSLCVAAPGYDPPTGLGTPLGPPASRVAPHVTGAGQVGATLGVTNGAWTGSPTGFAYAWRRCVPSACAATSIAGATGPTYVPTAADRGRLVWATVEARNGAGASPPAATDNRIAIPVPAAPAAQPRPTPAPPAVTPASRIAPAPAVAGLAIRPRAFRVGRRATVSFFANVAAFVTFKVQRARPGRRAGARCAAPSRANRRRPACTRYVRVRGSLRFPKAGLAAAGPASLTFTGRLRGAALAPGRYRLAAVARTAAGQASKVVFATFRVVR